MLRLQSNCKSTFSNNVNFQLDNGHEWKREMQAPPPYTAEVSYHPGRPFNGARASKVHANIPAREPRFTIPGSESGRSDEAGGCRSLRRTVALPICVAWLCATYVVCADGLTCKPY
jgi:hypothetical protein